MSPVPARTGTRHERTRPGGHPGWHRVPPRRAPAVHTLAHPRLALAAIASDSQPGEPVARAFPHLAQAACGDLRYVSIADASATAARHARSAVLAAASRTASRTRRSTGCSTAASAAGAKPSVVPISADYRFADLTELPARRANTRTALPRLFRSSPAPSLSTSIARRRPTSPIPAASSPHRFSPSFRSRRAACAEGPVFVLGGDRQHRRRSQRGFRHAPDRCATPTSTRTTRSPTATARSSARSRARPLAATARSH